MAKYKKLIEVDSTESFDGAFVIAGSKVKQITKEKMLKAIGISVNTEIVFRGADTTANIKAISSPAAGDKWYSTDENVYYLRGDSAWINVGSGEDYTEMISMLDELHDRVEQKANAIAETLEGERVFINDSEEQSLLGLRLLGKSTQIKTTGAQMLPILEERVTTDRGITQTLKGGVCTVKGTANSSSSFNLTLCGSYSKTEPIVTLEPGTYTAKDCRVVSYDGITRRQYEGTFTITERFGITWVATRSYAPGEVVNETTYPMLNPGFTSKPWEPYSGLIASPSANWPQYLSNEGATGDVEVSVLGKNMVNKIIIGATATQYGNCLLAEMDLFEPDTEYTISFVAAYGHKMYVNENLFSYQFITGTGKRQSITVRTKPEISKNKETQYTSGCWILLKNSEGNTILPNFKNVQVEIGPQCTDYEANKKLQTLYCTTPGGIPGVPCDSDGNYTDETGQQYICDEKNYERGVYIQRVMPFTVTTPENITVLGNTVRFNTSLPKNAPYDNGRLFGYGLCTHLPFLNAYSRDEQHFYTQGTRAWMYLPVECGTTAEELTTWLTNNPMTIIYQLETPIETPLPEDEILAFNDICSHNPNTLVLNDRGVRMEVKYAVEMRRFLQEILGHISFSDEQIKSAVDKYFAENPIEQVDQEDIAKAVSEYLDANTVRVGKIDSINLIDRVTGVTYSIYVSNGNLLFEKV